MHQHQLPSFVRVRIYINQQQQQQKQMNLNFQTKRTYKNAILIISTHTSKKLAIIKCYMHIFLPNSFEQLKNF